MRGFLLGALVLVAMDVLLTSNAAKVANLPTPFTSALEKWMDPTQPLISDHSGTAASSGGTGSTPGKTSQPGTGQTKPSSVKAIAGKCPPGYGPDPEHPGHCLQMLK